MSERPSDTQNTPRNDEIAEILVVYTDGRVEKHILKPCPNLAMRLSALIGVIKFCQKHD